MYLFKRRLKAGTGEICFVSFSKLFHARIVERKNELNYRCVQYPFTLGHVLTTSLKTGWT